MEEAGWKNCFDSLLDVPSLRSGHEATAAPVSSDNGRRWLRRGGKRGW